MTATSRLRRGDRTRLIARRLTITHPTRQEDPLRSLQWDFAPDPPAECVDELARSCQLPRAIAHLLASRDLNTVDLVRRFLHPTLADLHDPFSLPGMQGAVDRITEALHDREQIMVYGDYDVDGITSTSLLYLVLNRLGAEVVYYLPNRLIEGYGLSVEGVDQAVAAEVKLIITVDCGITAVEEIDYANNRGIEVVIADHHERGTHLPAATAIVNPKLAEGPIDELAAVGVAFKLAQALYAQLGQDVAELEEHLDLVALGTAADIVPLIGENRILTKFGLQQIERTRKPGLKKLCDKADIVGKTATTGQVLFILAPRINAAGRLGDAQSAVRLMSTLDDSVAEEIAQQLERHNRDRKKLDEHTLQQALAQVDGTASLQTDRAIVLWSQGWHQGVIGIVASRLVERFHLPTVMIAVDGDEGRASARSIPTFDVYEAFRACDDLLLRYGGHKYAAGMSIARERIPEFAERFKRVAGERLTNEDLIPRLKIDARLEPSELDETYMDCLDQFAPFGPQNPRPVFLATGVELSGSPIVVGRGHLKFRVMSGGRVYDCIGFGMGDRVHELAGRPDRFELAYIPERNEWDGLIRLQLRVKDFQVA